MANEMLFEIEEVLSPSELRKARWVWMPPSEISFCLLPSGDELSEPVQRDDLEDSFASPDEIGTSSRSTSERRRTGPPPWLVGFSRQFKKDTSSIDRKVMGKILEVLEEVSDYEVPFHVHGDTFKPLKGELEGCWRYRIGDNRLVLQPQIEKGQINAIAFGSRGSVYD